MKDIDTKEHYKMYKDGKKWVFASISVLSFLMMGTFSYEDVHADVTTNATSTSSEASSSANNLLASSSTVTLPDKQFMPNANSADATSTSSAAVESTEIAANSQTNVAENSSSSTNSQSQTAVSDSESATDLSSQSSPSDTVATSVVSSSENTQDNVKEPYAASNDAQNVNDTSETASQMGSTNGSVTVNSAPDDLENTVVQPSSDVATSDNNENYLEQDNSQTSDSTSKAKPDIVNAIQIDGNDKVVIANTSNNKNLAKVTNKNLSTVKALSNRHVTSWNEFTSALADSSIDEIIVDNNLKDPTWGGSVTVASRPGGSLLIRSNDDGRYAIDFQGSYPQPKDGSLNLTYENLDMYGTTYYGVVNSSSLDSATITFKNTSYTGAQLVYAGSNTTIIFQGKNTVKTTNQYISPVDGVKVNVGSSQQGIEFTSDNDHIIFDVDSEFDGSTFKDNVIHMTGNNSTIEVKNGAVVTLTPHDNGDGAWGDAEHGWNANGIYMAGSGVLTVDKGGTLKINADDDTKQGIAAISIIDSNTTVNIEDGADVEILVSGHVMNSNSANTAVYINGQLNVGKDAKFNVVGHNLNNFAGTLVQISGNANITGSIFQIKLDDETSGTGKLTLLNVGKNVLIDNPKDFLLYRGNNSNAQWIMNGSFNLNVVRLQDKGKQSGPFKHVSFTGSNGSISVSSADRNNIVGLTADDENNLVTSLNDLGSDSSANTLEFVQANDFVSIISNSITVINNDDGSKTIEGFTDTPGAYIHAVANGHEIVGNNITSPYWQENTDDSKVIYAAQAALDKDVSGKGYKFSFTIPVDVINSLPSGSTVDMFGTQNFVNSDIYSQDLGIISPDKIKGAINDAALTAKRHIDGLLNLTGDQKYNINLAIDNLANNATMTGGSIDQAANTVEANNIYNTIINKLNSTVSLADAQDKAVQSLTTAAQTSIDAINNNDSLTADEKTKLVGQVNDAVSDAQTNINNAETPEAAQSAETDGEKAIAGVTTGAELQAAKNAANNKLTDAAQTAINAINNNDSLTADEKTKLVGQVNDAVSDAQTNINNAETPEAAQSAETDGEKAIAGVTTGAELQAAKNAANNKLTDAAQTAIDAINNNDSLTADEKTKLVGQINDAVSDAQTNINNAETPETAQSAETDGETNINDVVTASKLQAAKNDANDKLTNAAQSAIDAINNNGSLTADEKTKLVGQVNDAVSDAQTNINNAETPETAQSAETDGETNINDVVTASKLQAAKNDANNKLTDAAQTAINAINNNDNLTADEKTKLVGQVNDAVSDAQTNINNAETIEAAQSAEIDGETAIVGVNTAGELQAAKNDANDKLTNAAQSAETDGETVIAGVTTGAELQAAKNAANNKLTDAAQSAINAINNNDNLTADEKTKLVGQVNDAVSDAQTNINNAETIEAAQSAETDGETAIVGVNTAGELQAAKNDANDKLTNAAQSAIDAINNNDNLTADEKTKLVGQVNDAVSDAQTNINNAETPETVQSAETDGETNINDVVTASKLQAAKNDANDKLTDAAQSAIDAINNNDSLTADEKTKLVGQINDAVSDAQTNINNAETPETAQSAETDGETNINDVVTASKLQAAKNDANDKLTNAAQTAINAINNNDSLTADEKTKLVGQVNDAVSDAQTNINNAETPEVAQSAETDGETNINDIVTASKLQAAKNDANNKLTDAAQTAINAINNNNSLTESEKIDLINQVNIAVNEAKVNIKNATTSEAVKNAEVNGENVINSIIEAAKLQAAKNEYIHKLEIAKQQAMLQIQHSQINYEEKDKLISQINDIYNETTGKVTKDSNIEDINRDVLNHKFPVLPNTNAGDLISKDQIFIELLTLLSLLSLVGTKGRKKRNR